MSPYEWKNKKGTGERICRCGSWARHWVNFSEQPWPDYCSVEGCYEKASLGAHVYQPPSKEEYIIPMCDDCNHKTDLFDLKSDVILVSANKSKTCDK